MPAQEYSAILSIMNRRAFGARFLGAALVPFALPQAPPLSDLRVEGRRVNDSLRRLSTFGRNSQGGVDRVAYSEADLAGRAFATGLMKEAGLSVSTDPAGNIIGKRAGSDPSRRSLMAGSHIDSVPQGGNFDGDVGSMSAIEVARTLHEAGVVLQHPLEVVIFANEEGGQTGARAMSGRLSSEDLDRVSSSGKTLREGIGFIGGDVTRLAEARRSSDEITSYLELHIEQGPVLDSEGISIGVVEGIVGIHRWMVTIEGFANHAGTTPMNARRDALLSAAWFIKRVNEEITAAPGRQVGTVGWIEAEPGAPNVIPGKVRLTLEMRDLDWDKIDGIFGRLKQASDEIGESNDTKFSFEEIYDNPPRLTDPRLQQRIESASQLLGLSSKAMPSGAGHDAQSLSHIVPVGMIFVPSRDGISHSAEEFTTESDVTNGANVLLQTILSLDRSPIGT